MNRGQVRLPKASIILPVFNGEKYLRGCIDSVLNQSMNELELLIGDDCSTDASRRIINSYADNRIRCFYNKKNIGTTGNFNKLLSHAKGPLIHILCQDDILEPDCLDAEVKFFAAHPDVGMSFCKPIVIDKDSKEVSRAALHDLPEEIPPKLAMQLFFYYGCFIGIATSACISKRCFDELGFWNESYVVAHDYDMWVRICRKFNLGVIHKHLVRIRSHQGQQSKSIKCGGKYIKENKKIISMIISSLPAELYHYACRYYSLRNNVLDVHFSLTCLFCGCIKDFVQIAHIIGLSNYMMGLLFWVLTLNNHFYRPKPNS